MSYSNYHKTPRRQPLPIWMPPAAKQDGDTWQLEFERGPLEPAKMPLDACGTTVAQMEPHEVGWVMAHSLCMDMSNRVWIDAEGFVGHPDANYRVKIRRTDNGVTVELPQGLLYTPWRKIPFEAVLPVLHIEIVPDAE